MRKLGKTVVNYGPLGNKEMTKVDYMVDSKGQIYYKLPWGQIVKDRGYLGYGG